MNGKSRQERQGHTNEGAASRGIFDAASEEMKAVLRARAKDLAQRPRQAAAAKESTEVLSFLLAHETYAVETSFIREVYPLTELTPVPCTPSYIFGIVNVRGQILAIIDIKKFFNLPEKGITNLNRVIVVQNHVLELGILADEIVGIRNIPADELHPPLPTGTEGFTGYHKGITSSGVILLDMERFLNDRQLIVHEEVEA